ncbi:MAG: O-antigen ligase family protein [Candidatus Roizmanbacteria bacterium]|nr:MAG: O-antigen ligase family protein [Candidatus Roizmanbacteria bacterium]
MSSVFQYFFYPDLRNLSYLGWDPHLYRVFGTFLEPAVLSTVLGLFFIFISINRLINRKYLEITLLTVCLILIALSFSRGVYIGFAISLGIYLWQKKNKYFSLFFAGFIVLILLLPKPAGEGVNLLRNSTIISRVNDYSAGIEVWKKDPIFGVGYNRISYAKSGNNQSSINHAKASFHSSFLILLAGSGIIGLVLFLFVLKGLAQINIFSFYSVIFLSSASLVDNLLLHPFILFVLFTMIAYAKGESRLAPTTIHPSDK